MYAAAYPDALGRTVAVADYGTNGGTALSRSATIPARSDTCLVTSMTFDLAGNQATTTDPAGLVVQMTFDALGRQTQQVKNPVTSSSSSSSSSSNTCGVSDDTNVTVQTSYTADGQISTITAVNSNTGNQITQYVYGTTLSDSAIATSNLKQSEVYPDSVDSDDCIKFTYNRQGQVTTKTDQNGTVHSFDFDKLGRGTEDRVTTLASGVDGAVLRIEKTFEVRGMIEHITSYDNATVGSGAIVNDVLFAYNSFGQVTADYQSHSGAVNVASTPKVQYAYLSGSANSIRPTSITYPNSRVLTYSYGTAGGANDALSRISALIDNDGTTQLAAYQYLGLGAFVEVDYTEPDIKYTLIDLSSTNDPDTGDIYSGLDRFSRIKDCRWYNYGTSTDAVRIKHGYDRAGNRLYREDPVAASYGKAFDELYAYDRTYRLIDMQRGTLNGSRTGITVGTKTFEQCWTLDATGNWQGFREDTDGNSSWDLAQARSDNKVNEITGVTNSTGSAWVAPAYNRNGNMTTVPQPADPTKGFTATYDAWNRLLKIVDVPTSQTVQENAYDGRTFRVVRKTYTAGVLSETRRMLYSTGWQVVEERTGATAERQFVWGRRYIDDLVVRDRDTTGGGTLNERLYVSQDPNWNTVAISTSVGAGQERYAYSAYGAVSFLTGAFAVRVSSLFDWEILYASYRWELFPRLYVVRYRVLHPRLGGWIQRDPVGYSDGLSLYEYITSRCTTSTDPFGLRMDDQSDQRRLDYLRCIMKELVEVASDYSRRPEPGGWDWRRVHERHQCTAYPPSFKSGSAPFPKHTFPETRELMLAFCRQYPTVGYFGVNVCDDDAASNWPVIPGLSIPRPIFEGREVDAMCSLTHEPLHNWGANKQSWTLLWIFPTGFDGHSKTTKEMIPPSGCRTVEDNVSDLVAWAGAQRWDPPGVSDKSYSKSLWDFIQAHCKRKVYDKYLNKKAKR